MQKWHLVPDVSKSKNMGRYFEAGSVIKSDKDKGNKNVIGFDWKNAFHSAPFENLKLNSAWINFRSFL